MRKTQRFENGQTSIFNVYHTLSEVVKFPLGAKKKKHNIQEPTYIFGDLGISKPGFWARTGSKLTPYNIEKLQKLLW